MSITTVNHKGCGSYGYLVRAYVGNRQPELSSFIAYGKHASKAAARREAERREVALELTARLMRYGVVGRDAMEVAT